LAREVKILLVDDEPTILRALQTVLESHDYTVSAVTTGEQAVARTASLAPDLVLLDLGLPGIDGFEVIGRIRTFAPTLPIVVVSAHGDDASKVRALDRGADDYVSKPFSVPELLARVRAALRRSGPEAEQASFDAGEFRVDLESRRVHVRGQEVRLTPKEFELFVYMARHPNRVLTHRTLLEAVWGEASQEQPEYLRVFMGQLRKKLEPDPSNPKYLVTEPWVGYRFNPNG
jgi:two-component system KDP operon response regulator KdpE